MYFTHCLLFLQSNSLLAGTRYAKENQNQEGQAQGGKAVVAGRALRSARAALGNVSNRAAQPQGQAEVKKVCRLCTWAFIHVFNFDGKKLYCTTCTLSNITIMFLVC